MMPKPVIDISITPLAIPADTDIVSLFEFYADSPWSMLLDSANSQHPNARFDILVADPLFTVTCKNGKSVYLESKTGYSEASQADPIEFLEKWYDATLPKKSRQQLQSSLETPLPFIGGLMGCFGYDLGKHFEQFEETNKHDFQAPDMAVGFYPWSIIKDGKNGQFYLCKIDSLASGAPNEAILLEKLNTQKPRTGFALTTPWRANMTQQDYHQKIANIHDYLRAGDCYQVNLAQRFQADYQGSEWHAYKTLRETNQAPFSAFVRLPQCAFLSISPERFLSVKDQVVESKPIKGTRPRDTDQDKDEQNKQELLASEKDKAENLMIVDLLRNDMSKSCEAGSINVPDLFKIESFAAVHHLVTTVRGKLHKQTNPLTLLKHAFPGGSITGAPKIRAMQIIDELEPDKRNIYCGSIGYLGVLEDMDSSICIRTLLCEQQSMYCWAGGGIVLDSQAGDEYQESLDKVARILPVLSEMCE